MKSAKHWEFAQADESAANKLTEEGLHPTVARILVSRGILQPDAADSFLHPKLSDLLPPAGLTDLDKAVERIGLAIEERQRIFIYGDYDVDGVTSTSLLFTFFQMIGVTVDYYIPERLEEGYGLNTGAIDDILERGCDLLITVDCGVTDVEAVGHARSKGLDVIITDHHRVEDRLPDALAVINPNRRDCNFPATYLTGVGIAFYLAAAVRSSLVDSGKLLPKDTPDLRPLLDLVALGTVADVAPLVESNRIFVRHGLYYLSKETRTGIRALKDAARIGKKQVDAQTIAFQIAPRINAAGRMSSSSLSVKLLTTQSVSESLQLAHMLEKANMERQTLQQKILSEALAMIEHDPLFSEKRSIVLASQKWHPGIVGIVAAKLVEQFNRPTVLIALSGEKGRGSARSIPGFDIHKGLGDCSEFLLGYGGHKYAAGVQILSDNVQPLWESFDKTVKQDADGDDTRPLLNIDDELTFAEIDMELLEILSSLEPFGQSNPEPVFLTKDISILERKKIGRNGKHLKLKVASDGMEMEAIWFGQGDLLEELPQRVDMASQIRLDTYFQEPRIVFHVKDIRPAT